MTSYTTLGILNLDWDVVDRDLKKYQDDAELSCATVDADDPYHQEWNDDLAKLQKIYKKYGYTQYNTRIWKSTNQANFLVFDWQDRLLEQLPLDHAVVTLTRQDAGQILPWHYDRHFMLRRLHPHDNRMIVRILIFMQDWKMGHVLQIHDDLLYNWKRGQAVVWHPNTYHVSANVGLEKKWTCNVTGFLNDESFLPLLQSLEMQAHNQALG